MGEARKPARSRFMGAEYRIAYTPEIKQDKDDCWGLTNHEEATILIASRLSKDIESEVLVHEVLHQMLNKSGMDLSPKREEQLVSFLGGAIAGHIADNPSFWRYLMRKT
jgi:hypothetical protein